MRIRIVKQPYGEIEGLSLDAYRVGQVYEVTTNLANYLVAEGFGVVEMRAKDPHAANPTGIERRKKL